MNNNRTPLFLMANLGSEMTRLIVASESNDIEKIKGASLRAENLLKEIEEFEEMKNRIQELDKIKDIIVDCNKTEHQLFISKKDIESYFLPFAMYFLKQNQNKII